MSVTSAAAPLGRIKPGLESAKLRSLFIRVRPAPSNLAERRAVLRALQRYADIEVFKKLAEDTSFVSIVSSQSAAQSLVNRSPMKYEFVTSRSDSIQPWGAPGITSPVEPILASTPSPNNTSKHTTDHLSQKSFEMHIFPSPGYKHKTTIRYAPVHGPWPEEDRKERDSFVYNALRAVVPRGIAAEALCDWETGGQLSDEARVLRAQSDAPAESHVLERQRRRKLRQNSGLNASNGSTDVAEKRSSSPSATETSEPS